MKIRCITCRGVGAVQKLYPPEVLRRVGLGMFKPSILIDARSGERIGVQTAKAKGWCGADLAPTEPCLTCDQTGWIDRETANLIIALRDK
jgi:hypothetical protein